MSDGSNVDGMGFRYWPFDLVPRPGERLVWAARPGLKKEIDRLRLRLGRHQAVSLHLLWADFGAGKTHTLLYIKQEADAGRFGEVLPLYSVLPKGCREFIDIYRAVVRAIPPRLIRNAYQAALQSVGREKLDETLADVWLSLPKCFQAISIGSEPQQRVALGWLHAETGVTARDLHGLSILGRIRSTDEAVLALCGIVRLFNLAGSRRVLLMVDEFQRVETLRRQQQEDINAGLHGFFNACGQGMSLLLSFSFGVESNIRHFLNPELLSRADPLRISIPKLSIEEGEAFLTDLLAQARDPEAPRVFGADLVPTIVSSVAAKFALTPRRLVKAAGLVFELASIEFDDGTLAELEGRYVSQLVANGEFARIDDEEDSADGIS